MRSLASLCITLVLAAAGAACGRERQPMVGYDGPCPSTAGQAALGSIMGRTLKGTSVSADGSSLVVEWFGVVPNPVTGKGPVVGLSGPGSGGKPDSKRWVQGAEGRWWLPVLTDGDVADLVERVTGSRPAGLEGETSRIYRETIGAR